MKYLVVPVMVILMAVAFGSVMVRAQVGPNTLASPQVTATQCAAATPVAANETTLLPASVPAPPGSVSASRLCYIVQNFSTTIPVAVGDAVSATQGEVLNVVPASQPTGSAGGSFTFCGTSALNACGIGGSAVVGAMQVTR